MKPLFSLLCVFLFVIFGCSEDMDIPQTEAIEPTMVTGDESISDRSTCDGCPNSLSIIFNGHNAGNCACLNVATSKAYYETDAGVDSSNLRFVSGVGYMVWIPKVIDGTVGNPPCDGTNIRVRLCKIPNGILELCDFDCFSYRGIASASGSGQTFFEVCADVPDGNCIEFTVGKFQSSIYNQCWFTLNPNFADDYSPCATECDTNGTCQS